LHWQQLRLPVQQPRYVQRQVHQPPVGQRKLPNLRERLPRRILLSDRNVHLRKLRTTAVRPRLSAPEHEPELRQLRQPVHGDDQLQRDFLCLQPAPNLPGRSELRIGLRRMRWNAQLWQLQRARYLRRGRSCRPVWLHSAKELSERSRLRDCQ
jgi:hypothetical protein